MKPSALIEQISWDLNDQEPGYEYARWPYERLSAYLQEALEYAALALKDIFVEKVVVRLEPGLVWQDACECEDIIRVLGETTADGSRILRQLRRMADDETLLWQGEGTKRCSYGFPYRMEGYTIDATTGKSFMVFPPLPAYEKKPRYVLLECFIPPSVSTDTDLPYEVSMAVKQWALWRALSLDTENNETIFTVAKEHRDTFYKLITDIRTMKMMELQNENGGVRPAQDGSA